MHLKINIHTRSLSFTAIMVLILSALFMAQVFSLQLTETSEYTNCVSNYVTPAGNFTYVAKPMFPVLINNSQIPIGENWTIICPLQAGHSYHIYFYGAYVNKSSAAKTDYDIYVYDPQGNLQSSHFESAGLPPHLGTTTNNPLFVATQSGNYTFVINNEPFGSEGAQQATFMIIENLQCDKWYNSYVEGTKDDNPSFYTNWAYEFVTNQSHVELYINVPSTIDMYEARLYLMNNALSPSLDSFPLAWEPGLYGNLSDSVGGYNFDPNGYRGVAYTNEEKMGQSMLLNYTSPNHGENLYQLVLIGNVGSGNIQLMIKTNFEKQFLTPLITPSQVYSENPTEIAFTSNENNLESAQISYTKDNWTNSNTLDMDTNNQTCNVTIPGQNAGSLVQYQIKAIDVLENNLEVSGSYAVKDPSTLNITTAEDEIHLGENITINGILNIYNKDNIVAPDYNSSMVGVQYSCGNYTKTVDCLLSGDGTFVASFRPNFSGRWTVFATSPETQTNFRSDSQELVITVTEPPIYVRYSLFIIAALFAAVTVCGVVYFLKFKGS